MSRTNRKKSKRVSDAEKIENTPEPEPDLSSEELEAKLLKETCSVCRSSDYKRRRDGIQCNQCETWYHRTCIKMPKDVYKSLTHSEELYGSARSAGCSGNHHPSSVAVRMRIYRCQIRLSQLLKQPTDQQVSVWPLQGSHLILSPTPHQGDSFLPSQLRIVRKHRFKVTCIMNSIVALAAHHHHQAWEILNSRGLLWQNNHSQSLWMSTFNTTILALQPIW